MFCIGSNDFYKFETNLSLLVLSNRMSERNLYSSQCLFVSTPVYLKSFDILYK